LEYDEIGEDPWEDLEFMTYRCNSIKVSHIPSEPMENSHDCEEDLDDIIKSADLRMYMGLSQILSAHVCIILQNTPAHIVFRGGIFWLQLLHGKIFHQKLFSSLFFPF
jgi:hypothetical protein